MRAHSAPRAAAAAHHVRLVSTCAATVFMLSKARVGPASSAPLRPCGRRAATRGNRTCTGAFVLAEQGGLELGRGRSGAARRPPRVAVDGGHDVEQGLVLDGQHAVAELRQALQRQHAAAASVSHAHAFATGQAPVVRRRDDVVVVRRKHRRVEPVHLRERVAQHFQDERACARLQAARARAHTGASRPRTEARAGAAAQRVHQEERLQRLAALRRVAARRPSSRHQACARARTCPYRTFSRMASAYWGPYTWWPCALRAPAQHTAAAHAAAPLDSRRTNCSPSRTRRARRCARRRGRRAGPARAR